MEQDEDNEKGRDANGNMYNTNICVSTLHHQYRGQARS